MASVISLDDIPGLYGREQDNRREIELFIASNIGETLLARAYILMETEGLLDTVFYTDTPPLSSFLSWLKRPNSKYLGCFLRPLSHPEKVDLCGLSWLWDIQGPPGGRRAECGMVFFKGFQKDHIPEDLTEKTLDYAFGEVGCDVLYGITPVRNRAATLFSRKMGFEQTQPLPKYGTWHGEPTDVILSFLTKERWQSSYSTQEKGGV